MALPALLGHVGTWLKIKCDVIMKKSNNKKVMCLCRVGFKTIALNNGRVADPGFPVGVRQPRRGGADYRGSYISKNLYVKMKECGPSGGGGAPPDPPMLVILTISVKHSVPPASH